LAVVVLVVPTGCQMFNKKNGGGDSGPFLGASSGDKSKPAPVGDPLVGSNRGGTDLDGLIAGQVLDSVGRPTDAEITWVCLDDAKDQPSTVSVASNSQGYFMIQGLKPGKHYKLVARTVSGERTIEMVKLTQAPDVHVLIKMDEKFAVPGGGKGGGGDKGKKQAGKPAEQPASAQIPAGPPGYPGGAWQPPEQLPPDKSRIADDPALVVKPPTMDIKPGWKPQEAPVPPVTIAPPVAPSQLSVPTGPAPVPSCVKIGKRVENFALNDISLTPWELKANRKGRLVLLDFWKTNCPPCLQAIPTLRVLNDRYGPQGLDVVAIAYEDNGTPPEQAHRVAEAARYRQTNYMLLLGGGPNCPVKQKLEVNAYPTLILLDEMGVIVWRHTGALERQQVDDLEFAIKRRLTPN
jgi:thiol-disulfide isomerase/thioredoxin